MADDIPPDFDRPWGNSNVVLETLNSDGKELHANKAVLSVFSPYFNALFSGRFADNNMTSVKMECNYNAMKEVLRNIHQIGFSYKPNGLMQYNLEMLRALYTIGDFYNFPHIRRLCLDQMPERPGVGMAIVAADFGLRDTVMEILIRLEIREVRRFLSNKNVKHLFTKKELLRIFEKVAGEKIPKYPLSLKILSTLSPKPMNLEDITVEIANPRIDLTKPWEMADLSIYTKNSRGRLLYSNTTAMNLVSNKFKNLQFIPIILDGKELSSTTVDAEYTTMKEILAIIHHCDTNYKNPDRVLHPALLHSMYRLASEDQLNIPMIRDLCVARLMKQNTIDSLVVLHDVNFQELTISNFDLSLDDWCDWIYGDHESLSYRMGEDVVVVAPSRDEPHLNNSIPPEFDRAWSKSDVVLHTLNSNGKELHANKTVLSMFSPYFDALFSGRFNEKDVASVEMNCDYTAMKEVLRNIHQIGFSYKLNGLKQYGAQMLKELYIIGDFYNFAHIRNLCLDQMPERFSADMIAIATSFNLQETVLAILQNMRKRHVQYFLDNKNVPYIFTKKEVICLFEKFYKHSWPPRDFAFPLPVSSSTKPLNLEEVSEDIQSPRIDLTQPWELADVVILTKNSRDRFLYSNKMVIDSVSVKFKNLSFSPMETDSRLFHFTTVDAEYTTMKEILSVIHLFDTNYRGYSRKLHPALLHSMYLVASEEQLDISLIRDLCVAKLQKESSIDSLEVLCALKVHPEDDYDVSVDDLRDWIYREDEHLSYYKRDEVVVLTPSQNQPYFEKSLVKWLIDQLSEPSFKKVNEWLYGK